MSQIVDQVCGLVAAGGLKALDKMPSVRSLARQTGVSAFTVVEAYDRLVAGGQLVSRRGAGYYVAAPAGAARSGSASSRRPGAAFDPADPLSQQYCARSEGDVPLGCSWLPADWHDAKWMQDCARTALRSGAALLHAGAHALGNSDLRRQLACRLHQHSIEADPDQLLLTRGALHAFDLVLGVLAKPGDHILVEDPSHPGLLPLVARHGCIAIPVARGADGLDLAKVSELAERRRPKLGIVTTVLHNPLGTSLPAPQAHRLLALAEQFDFMLVEDDVFRDLADARRPSLTVLDGLKRVIRVDSTSKLMPSLARVGSIAAAAPIVAELAKLRMITGSAGTEFAERVALHALSSGEYRRHLARTRSRLEQARGVALQLMPHFGLEPLAVPEGGMFLSARVSNPLVSFERAMQVAQEFRVILSPATRFTNSPAGVWFRLNLAYADHAAVRSVFTKLAQER